MPGIGDAPASAYAADMNRAVSQSEQLADIDLHTALADARILTLYQPIVRIADCRPIGLEVLARLDHPQRGTLAPGMFVAPMEDAGLARQLSEAVIRRAFADWGDGRLDAFDLTLAVNLPLDVLLIPEMLAWLDRERADAGIAAKRIVIELTESQPVARLPELAGATGHLRARGYGLAIDDVGPNIRDHSALLDLPFTMLKLDKQLVQEARSDGGAADFLTATLAAARKTGLTVIAEGVEDAATWAHMAGLGVDHAQGFLVSHPLVSDAVAPWMRRWQSQGGP